MSGLTHQQLYSGTSLSVKGQMEMSEIEAVLTDLKEAASLSSVEDRERLLGCLRLTRNLVAGLEEGNDRHVVQFFTTSFPLWVRKSFFLY